MLSCAKDKFCIDHGLELLPWSSQNGIFPLIVSSGEGDGERERPERGRHVSFPKIMEGSTLGLPEAVMKQLPSEHLPGWTEKWTLRGMHE